MRVVGFIKEKNENTFANPVYSNRSGEYFSHILDASYDIISFIKTEIKKDTFKKIYLSKKFEINSKGGLVFIGKEDYLKYDSAENAIEEIINYINDVLAVNESKLLLTEANALKKLREKNADFIVLNSMQTPGAGFRHDTNQITILKNNGEKLAYQLKSKHDVAIDIVNEVVKTIKNLDA